MKFFPDSIPDGIPDAVPFRAEPDSNSSIYVEWSETTPNTDPLLLRYLVSVSGPLGSSNSGGGDAQLNFDLLSGERNLVVGDLQPNAAYQVAVTASSLRGVAPVPRPLNVSTFPNGKKFNFNK